MSEEILKVHGSIFFLLKKYVDNNFPEGTWNTLNATAGTSGIYYTTESYPLTEMGAIVSAASDATGIPVHDLKEKFGTYLVPDLFLLYTNYLKPGWKTYDVLLHTENVMHGAVRKLNSTATPPILNVTQLNDNVLIIDYYSKRRMGALAVGIIKGIAEYYNEAEEVLVIPKSNPDDERVQLRVEFKKKLT